MRRDDTATAPRFGAATEGLLDQASALCAGRGASLTALRRRVLGLVLESERPSGAYDLLDRLRADGRGAAPPTVYRALDFLLEQGLVHKVERLSAFVGCRHGIGDRADAASAAADVPATDRTRPGEPPPSGGPAAETHGHAAQFLICRRCGGVTEMNDPEIGRALRRAAGRSGFVLQHATIEAEGVCAACITRPAAN